MPKIYQSCNNAQLQENFYQKGNGFAIAEQVLFCGVKVKPLYRGVQILGVNFGMGSIGLNSDVIEKLAKKGIDPIEELAELFLNVEDAELRFKILKDLASYTTPKLRSTEVKISGKVNAGVAILKFQDVNPARAAQLALQAGAQITEGQLTTSLDMAAAKRLQGEQPTPLDKQVMAAVKKFAVPSGAMVEHLRREGEKELQSNLEGEIMTAPIVEGDGHVLPYEDMEDVEEGEIIDVIAETLGGSTAGS